MKYNIAIITGGYSGENVISYKTADTALQHMDPAYFMPYIVDIRREGWFVRAGEKEIPIDRNDFSFEENGVRTNFQCAYLALHGTPGEDGKLQAYFDMISLPYTSGDTLNLSLTFNKKFTTAVLGAMGFKVARSLLARMEDQISAVEILEKISLPVFVKPNNGGSSIGISKVKDASALIDALDRAFHEDREIIIEEFIEGREFTCGVTFFEGKIQALPVTEIISGNEFFDFEAKYEGKSEEITPARLNDEQTRVIQHTAEQIYKVLNCRGNIRIDFILSGDDFYIIEVNTIPGMSAASIVPQQLKIAGISLQEVITQQILRSMSR